MVMPKYTQLLGDRPPEQIHLPDGRSVPLKDLTSRRHNYAIIRIKKFKYENIGRPAKYSDEERRWMLSATVSEIQQRYNIPTPTQAWSVLRDTHMKFGLPMPSRKTWPK